MSSSTEDHKFIADARKYAPELDGKGRDEVYSKAATELALLSPNQRTALIQAVDSELQVDESNLRQKAQLLALKRHMVQADANLKRAGR